MIRWPMLALGLPICYLDLAPAGSQTYYYVVEATFQSWTSVYSNEDSEFVPGGVARIGSWGTGTSHTAAAGTNRALVFVAGREDGSLSTLTSVTYGGQALTKVISQDGPPGPPTNLVSSPGAGTDVDLTWTASTDTGVEGYNILRSTTSGSGYSQVGTVVGRLTVTHTDSPPSDETSYYYVVRAYIGAQESADTNEAVRAVLGAVADAEVDENNPNANFETGSPFLIQSVGSNNHRAFLRFDVSGIPVAATVDTARLSLFLDAAPPRFAHLRGAAIGRGLGGEHGHLEQPTGGDRDDRDDDDGDGRRSPQRLDRHRRCRRLRRRDPDQQRLAA